MNSLLHILRRLGVSAGILAGSAFLLAGCGRDKVETYEVSKTTPQATAQPMAMPPGHPDLSATAPRLTWKLPESWEEAAPGEMRVASFRVKGKDGKQADVGIVPLPGLIGHDLDNVNRWRSTVGQPAVTEADLAKLAQPVEVAGVTAQVYDQGGENPGSGDKTRILAAILRRDEVAWFIKMAGDDELVAQQKPAFIDFLKSLQFPAGAAGQAGLPASHPPIGDSSLISAQATMPAAAPAEGRPVWQVPPSWKEVPAGQFLVAKFVATDANNAQAAVNVSRSAGAGGGVTGNVNRWRQQLGLGELSEADLGKLITSVDVSGGKASFVDMSGTDARSGQKARLIGAILPQGNDTWFYKLMGNDQIVEREKEAFSNFIKTAKYPNAS